MTGLNPNDLLDAGEVADLLGLSSSKSISVYRSRYDDFPQPLSERLRVSAFCGSAQMLSNGVRRTGRGEVGRPVSGIEIEVKAARTLSYLAALATERHNPTLTDLDEFGSYPDRNRPGIGGAMSYLRAFESLSESGSESMSHYLLRMGWIDVREGRVRLTPTGNALERALRHSPADDKHADPIEVVLDPDDQLVRARLVEWLAEVGPGLLVDPYFRIESLQMVLESTSINRVLTTRKIKAGGIAGLRAALTALPPLRRLEVRVTSADVHDRHVIGDDAQVHFIGASINTIGKSMTVVGRISDVGPQISQHYEDLWSKAEEIGRIEDLEDPDPVEA
jgi:hypothetical protein